MPLEFVLVAFNPLVFYQFCRLSGFIIRRPGDVGLYSHRCHCRRTGARHPLVHFGLGVTIYLAIHTKLYGRYCYSLSVYLLMHGRQLVIRSSHRAPKIGFWQRIRDARNGAGGGQVGYQPLLAFTARCFVGYVSGIVDSKVRDVIVIGSLSMLGFAVLLIFHAALLFLATRAAWRAWAPSPTVFATIYLLALFTFLGLLQHALLSACFPFLVRHSQRAPDQADR